MGMQFALLVEIALTDLLKYEGGGGAPTAPTALRDEDWLREVAKE